MPEMTQVQVIKTFFGMKPDETLSEFMVELKALTAEDKKELAEAAAEKLGVVLK